MSIYMIRNGRPELTGTAQIMFQNAAREFECSPEYLLTLWLEDWHKRKTSKKKTRRNKGDPPNGMV